MYGVKGLRLAAGPGVLFRGAGILHGVLIFRVLPHFQEQLFQSRR